jgi:sugar phosphate isomerase/epimerase
MKELSRRAFLRNSLVAGLAVPGHRLFGQVTGTISSGGVTPRPIPGIGVCTSLANAPLLKSAGCDYLEESVGGFLSPSELEEGFALRLEASKAAKIPIQACNGFLPGALKAVGPAAKPEEILVYAGAAFRRAAAAGISTIVWGSGESRRIPDGFSRTRAEEQFRALAGTVAAAAAKSGILVVLEPLNSAETNFLNSLAEGAALVEAVGHPNFRLLADFYHVVRADETPETVVKFGGLIRHCHIAEKDKRTPPGTAGDDFRPFLKALNRIGYKGGISLECRWDDMKAQLPGAVAFLRKQIAEAAGRP